MKNVIFKKNPISLAVLTTLFFTPPSFAQESDDKKLEEVVIVGSRISRTADFDGPIPVQTIGRDAINKSGYNNLQQILQRIPAAGSGTFSTRGNNQDSSASGAAAISLRGMGADATLVLVNGRRVAASSFSENITTSFVDINAMPVSAIERVEVLKDGASAVYGSDAVAGVVNIVLRKDFEGFEVSAGYGNTLNTDASEQTFSAIWGVNGENNSNITLIFDHFKNSTLMNRDRGPLGTANQAPFGGKDQRSSRGYPGSFSIDIDGPGGIDAVNMADPSCPADRITEENNCSYDYGPWNLITPEAERTGLLLLGHQDLTNNIEIFTEIGVQHNTSIAQGAPTPLDSEAGLTVPIDHPNNPFTGLGLQPGVSTININRYRTVDAGPRQWDIETDNLRMVLGFRGEINDWNWETSVQRARSESTQTGNRSQGWVRTDFLQQQIDLGNYNPFGATTNPQSVLDAIRTSLVRLGESEQTSFEASINGELFEMAGGLAAIAVGAEYREESIKDSPDDQFQRNLIFGTESVSASGERDITSAFVELALPVLENVDVTLAARHDDYSDFGTTTNPMINARWAVSDNISLRASWGTGFRAPSLSQIGLGPSKKSQFFLDTFGCYTDTCKPLDYTVEFTGNADLQPEESESYNLGLIVDATESLRVSLDYWQIVQEDKIDELPVGNIYLENCNDQNSTICKRAAPAAGQALGQLISIKSRFVNAGEQTVTGADLGVNYSTDFGPGSLTLRLDYSYLLEYERVRLNSDGVTFFARDIAGEYNFPEHRWTASADWEGDSWGANIAINYVGEFNDTPDFDKPAADAKKPERSVDAFATLNLQARYTGFEDIQLSFGIDNALDEDPPFAIGDGNNDLYGYASGQHDPRGRFAYGKVTYSF